MKVFCYNKEQNR